MQLFLRNLAGATKTLQLDEGSTVRQLKLVVQVRWARKLWRTAAAIITTGKLTDQPPGAAGRACC